MPRQEHFSLHAMPPKVTVLWAFLPRQGGTEAQYTLWCACVCVCCKRTSDSLKTQHLMAQRRLGWFGYCFFCVCLFSETKGCKLENNCSSRPVLSWETCEALMGLILWWKCIDLEMFVMTWGRVGGCFRCKNTPHSHSWRYEKRRRWSTRPPNSKPSSPLENIGGI